MDPSRLSKQKDKINEIKPLLLDKFYNFKLRKCKHYKKGSKLFKFVLKEILTLFVTFVPRKNQFKIKKKYPAF